MDRNKFVMRLKEIKKYYLQGEQQNEIL
jgi:hypothetical protein